MQARDRTRIDVARPDESVEAKSLELLSKLKNGEISVSDLMGPLFGLPDRTPNYVVPPGQKMYFPSAPEAEFYPMDEHNKILGAHNTHLIFYNFLFLSKQLHRGPCASKRLYQPRS